MGKQARGISGIYYESLWWGGPENIKANFVFTIDHKIFAKKDDERKGSEATLYASVHNLGLLSYKWKRGKNY